MRFSPTGLALVADSLARHAAAATTGAKKVAAVDLDGTLWGGVIGEEGIEGIEIGSDGIGLAFQDFQRALLRLADIGVLLAVCSKNDRPLAIEALDSHPAMILRSDSFVAERIDWRDKATSLRELAGDLGLGLDSFVFLDDNPIEREWVRRALPEVLVPELPEDPVERPAFLRRLDCFDRIAVTDADRRRAGDYRLEGERRKLRSIAVSYDDYLASLEQVVRVEPVSGATLGRAVQLCQRTNQFNLTTRRHDAAALGAFMSDSNVELWTLAVSDRFSDSGITGLAVLRLDEETAEIDTFLLSCRVLGRRIEEALLAFLARRAGERGATRLAGSYLATAKNGQTADFYSRNGFAENAPGRFELALNGTVHAFPPAMRIETPVSSNA